MKELKDKFYKNCLFLVQNFKDASERDIEQQVNDVANMPIFKDIDQLSKWIDNPTSTFLKHKK